MVVGLMLFTGILLAYVRTQVANTLLVYENGVARIDHKGTHSLSLDDIAQVQYRIEERYINSRYTGHMYLIEVHARSGKVWKFEIVTSGPDTDLESVLSKLRM